MSDTNLLTWENFQRTVSITGEQRVHRVSITPLIEIYVDGVNDSIGLILEGAPNDQLTKKLNKLRNITVELNQVEGRPIVNIRAAGQHLQRQFYAFASSVIQRIISKEDDWKTVVVEELACFSELLSEVTLLSKEKQIGLLGELNFLKRLISARGDRALACWTGPFGEAHDFRVNNHEFEIKTTIKSRRVHKIHGLTQLLPSEGCSLFIFSTMLRKAGTNEGESLQSVCEEIGSLLKSEESKLEFRKALISVGYRETDSKHYKNAYKYGRQCAVIPVNGQLPRLTPESLAKLFGERVSRFESVDYDLNFEGLEYEEDSQNFRDILSVVIGD